MRISDWSSDVCSSDLGRFDQIGAVRNVDGVRPGGVGLRQAGDAVELPVPLPFGALLIEGGLAARLERGDGVGIPGKEGAIVGQQEFRRLEPGGVAPAGEIAATSGKLLRADRIIADQGEEAQQTLMTPEQATGRIGKESWEKTGD